MAPTAISTVAPSISSKPNKSEQFIPDVDPDPILPLQVALVSESTPLAVRFRALFSLKHYASEQPPTPLTLPAIEAIAAAFSSQSALLKHELAYCLGQTGNMAAVPWLRNVLEDRREDGMCRHEAAEALGALGDLGSLKLLMELRDDAAEMKIVRETCDIAVERIQWEHGAQRRAERVRNRCVSCI